MKLPVQPARADCVVAVLLAFSSWTHAQSAGTGALEGAVRDGTGNAVPNAEALLLHPATGQRYAVQTDDAGSFRFALLTPGDYELKLAATGYKTARMAHVVVSVSETPVVEAK